MDLNNQARMYSSLAPNGFLGGLLSDSTTSRNNNVPSDTFYRSMNRSALSSLPGVHSGCKAFATSELQEAYTKIYAGDFIMTWGTGTTDDDQKELFMIAALDDEDDDDDDDRLEQNASERLRGSLLAVHFVASLERYKFNVSTHEPNSMDSPFARRFCRDMTENQREALICRILHIFVRTQGAHQHHILCQGIIDYLRTCYSAKHYWKEIVDVNIIAADLAFNTSHGCIITELIKVGEALEAVGRFQDAGTLYEEISSRFFDDYRGPNHDQAFLHKASALAYCRAQNFKDSERVYISTLHHTLARTGGSWALTDTRTERVFGDMISMYIDWQIKDCRDKGTTEADAALETALGILAFSAGIGSEYILEYKESVCMVKTKYQRKKFAQKTLALAVSAPVSVEKFRKTLLGCLSASLEELTRKHTPGEASIADARRSSKKAARELNTSQYAPRSTTRQLRCSNPGCLEHDDESKIRFCPCQTVCYVSS